MINGLDRSDSRGAHQNTLPATSDIPDLWKKAYDQLRAQDPKLVQRYERVKVSCAGLPEDASVEEQSSKIIDAKMQEIVKGEWSFSWKGDKVRVRDQVNYIVKVIRKLQDVGSAAASLDPVHAGLPWAAICVVLPVRAT